PPSPCRLAQTGPVLRRERVSWLRLGLRSGITAALGSDCLALRRQRVVSTGLVLGVSVSLRSDWVCAPASPRRFAQTGLRSGGSGLAVEEPCSRAVGRARTALSRHERALLSSLSPPGG